MLQHGDVVLPLPGSDTYTTTAVTRPLTLRTVQRMIILMRCIRDLICS